MQEHWSTIRLPHLSCCFRSKCQGCVLCTIGVERCESKRANVSGTILCPALFLEFLKLIPQQCPAKAPVARSTGSPPGAILGLTPVANGARLTEPRLRITLSPSACTVPLPKASLTSYKNPPLFPKLLSLIQASLRFFVMRYLCHCLGYHPSHCLQSLHAPQSPSLFIHATCLSPARAASP
jgi:hypothetical protein